MHYVTYLRVSTDRQGKSGLGLDAQRKAVADHVAGKGEIAAEYVEIESGKKNDRPQLALVYVAVWRFGDFRCVYVDRFVAPSANLQW